MKWLPVLIASFAFSFTAVAADDYPTKPINLIVPFPVGGGTDVQMRALAAAMSKELNQPIIVSNKPGAGGTLGPASMAHTAKPDGYTVSLVGATLLRLPYLQKTSYDPSKDFTYIINLSGYTNGIVVKADAPWKNLKELIAYAKQNPGKVSYGSSGVGSNGQIAMERLAKATGVSFNFVPYKGMAEETSALLGGHIDVISDPGWGPMARADQARVLATLGDKRLEQWPNVPTLKDQGYDIVVHSPIGIAGPRGMEPGVTQKLHDAIKRAMEDPGYLATLAQNDQPILYMDSHSYRDYMEAQFAREKTLVQDLGITLQQ